MKAIIIPFTDYTDSDDPIGKLLLEYVQSNIPKYNVDVIYLIGKNMFENKTEQYGRTKVVYIDQGTNDGSFQANFLTGVEKLKSGDKFILMDSDTLIYDFTLIDDLFRDLEIYDLVNCVDNGTRLHPTYDKYEERHTAPQDENTNLPYNLWIMKPTEYRRGRTRFTHWIFACNYDFFKKHSSDFLDGNYEAFEPFARSIAKNDPYAKIKELPEIRTNIAITEDITEPQIQPNNDDIRVTEQVVKTSKYYHVRNFGGLAQAISQLDQDSYKHSPFAERNYLEIMRIVAWNFVIMEKVWTQGHIQKYKKLTNRIFSDLEIRDNLNSDKFKNYLREFKQFHRTWLL